MSHSLQLHGLQPTMLLCPWNFPLPSLGDRLNLGIQPEFPTLQAASLPSESPGKPAGESKACFFEAKLGHVACWQLEGALSIPGILPWPGDLCRLRRAEN